MVIATKAGFVIRNGERIVDTSRRALLRDLDGSLERLGTDYVDLWQIHACGEAPLDETLGAVDHAVSTGQVRYAGVSQLRRLADRPGGDLAERRSRGVRRSASAQVEYSLLARRAEVEVLPAARGLRDGLLPLVAAGSRGADRPVPQPAPRAGRGPPSDHFAWFVEPYLEQRSRGVVEAVVRAADGLDLTPLQVALLWVRDAPGVTAPLLGARTPGQLAPALARGGPASCRTRSSRPWTTCPAGRTRRR